MRWSYCTLPSQSVRLWCSNCYPVISRKCISPSPAQIAPEPVDQDSDDDDSSSSSSRSSNSSSESDEDEQDTRDGQDEEEEDEAESQVWPNTWILREVSITFPISLGFHAFVIPISLT